jgi:hypothetical protein
MIEPSLTMPEFLIDPNLIGVDPIHFRPWLALHRAGDALKPGPGDQKLFTQCTGRIRWPEKPAKILILIIGRRGEKTANASMRASFVACQSHPLARGEWATIPIVCPTKKQARIARDYISSYFQNSEYLRSLVVNETVDTITLSNRNRITVMATDFRSVRGFGCPLVILDEACFFTIEGVKSDEEVVRAFLPSLSTLNGTLLVLSSPRGKWGWVWDQYCRYYGTDNDDVLIWQAPSLVMNPRIDRRMIELATEQDPQGARSEWQGLFRDDISQLFSPEAIEKAILKGVTELPCLEGIQYGSFADPAGGGDDAFTLSIGHREGEKVIQDMLLSRRGDPYQITREYAGVLKKFRVREVTGDKYGAAWCSQAFEKEGIHYKPSDLTKSELYLEALPRFNGGQVSILDNKELVTQLRLLERKTASSGKDTIDHGPGGHDDLANSTAGLIAILQADQEPAFLSYFRQRHETLFQGGGAKITGANLHLDGDIKKYVKSLSVKKEEEDGGFYAGEQLNRPLTEAEKTRLLRYGPRFDPRH